MLESCWVNFRNLLKKLNNFNNVPNLTAKLTMTFYVVNQCINVTLMPTFYVSLPFYYILCASHHNNITLCRSVCVRLGEFTLQKPTIMCMM